MYGSDAALSIRPWTASTAARPPASSRNERAVIETRLAGGMSMLLVPVAAILVAGIRLTFLDTGALLRRQGAGRHACCAPLQRGEEMGWFEHGSTILVFLPPMQHWPN
ncbi:phosphatidylserine decarboxylase [Sphingomonas mucosissima]|uniref:phosphatidylserine decarboxylase n=1 Tax=Sphingomonas mucosissima TaxID=370959 RepID=UPI003183B55A